MAELVFTKVQVLGVEKVLVPVYEFSKDEKGNAQIDSKTGKYINVKVGEKDGFRVTYLETFNPLDFTKIIPTKFPEIKTDTIDKIFPLVAGKTYWGAFEEKAEMISASDKTSFSKGRKKLVELKERID